MELAFYVASRRRVESLAKGIPDKHGYNGDEAFDKDANGACGEMAVAKALNRFWSGPVNTFKNGGDIGKNIQVRTTPNAGNCLIIRGDDPNDQWFVLVIGKAPRFDVVGYIRGSDAKKEEFERSPVGRPPAYFVPATALKPFNPKP
jgi:hypothetical protein